MWEKIKKFLSEFLKYDGAIEETILMISIIFVISMIILLFFVFVFKKDMPTNITNYMEAIWGTTIGAYIGKGIYRIYKIKFPPKD